MSAKVLLVDDSPVARHAVAKRLRAAGIEHVEADSVAAAKRLARAGIACALLDLELPDGDGLDVATHLRAALPDLPIAFWSGGASDDVMRRARATGNVFAKPGELDAAIAWIVAQRAHG